MSIDLIPPRGCAFVCMNRRMDANRALKNLHKFRLHGKQITLAWAPGKGMKVIIDETHKMILKLFFVQDKQWKEYWDLDLGCSYIPLDKVNSQVNIVDDVLMNSLFQRWIVSGESDRVGRRRNF